MRERLYTDKVAVYDERGIKVGEIKLPQYITPAVVRRGGYADNGIYYKGAGIVYRGHMTNEPEDGEKIIRQEGVMYQKYTVVKPALIKKFGIFLFKHQPAFSDMEGCCGPKEKKLLVNQRDFEFSAIEEIVDVIDTGIDGHSIYAYKTRDVTSSPDDILRLFEYVLQAGYNSAWDKNLWADVMGYCYVRDLADWFKSDELAHKLGTIYALLKSIYAADKYLYTTVTNAAIGYNSYDSLYIPYISALIVRRYCERAFDGFEYDLDELNVTLYRKLLELIYSGKACCNLEHDSEWNWVRDEYARQIDRNVQLFEHELQLDRVRMGEYI